MKKKSALRRSIRRGAGFFSSLFPPMRTNGILRAHSEKLHGDSQKPASLQFERIERGLEFGDSRLDIILYGVACG